MNNIEADLACQIQNLSLFKVLNEAPNWLPTVEDFKRRYKKFLICGLGGSILTTQALLPLSSQNNIRILDSIDPITLNRLQHENLDDTGIIFISKSGSTSEILCQISALSPKNALVITQLKSSPLLDIAEINRWPIIPHPSDIGGRFSAFTAVGYIPCLLMGLNPEKFIAGATMALEQYTTAAAQAEKLFYAYQKGYQIHVLWGYGDYFSGLLSWCTQLIAESLGKKDIYGKAFGFQPVVNTGTLDQHSQLQLYLDGPHKYVFSLLRVNCDTIPVSRSPLKTHHHDMMLYNQYDTNSFLKAHFYNTNHVLQTAGHHVRDFILPNLSEKSFGFIMMQFILEVLTLAKLANVNPFDQPAVEQSKKTMERFL